MMSGVTKFWIIAALLVLAGLEMGAAQDLPKNFPANVIPIPEDAVQIRDLPGFVGIDPQKPFRVSNPFIVNHNIA